MDTLESTIQPADRSTTIINTTTRNDNLVPSIAAHDNNNSSAAATSNSNSSNNQQQQNTAKANKITQRSQSSPSSLTTPLSSSHRHSANSNAANIAAVAQHRFELRPTPSPPRLILDQQTGDIVENYPPEPSYISTYQPATDSNGNLQTGSLNTTATIMQQGRGQAKLDPIWPPHVIARQRAGVDLDYDQGSDDDHIGVGSRDRPGGSSSRRLLQQSISSSTNSPRNTASSQSYRKATQSQLQQQEQPTKQQQKGRRHHKQKRNDCSLSKAVTGGIQAGVIDAKHHPAAARAFGACSPMPSINDFNLYDASYIVLLLVATTMSVLGIYLIFTYLMGDCLAHRPSYTYLSVFILCLNLLCIVIFTFFWYFTSVTRTLYSNLSSSAFIVTIYAILAVTNLILAIVLFLVNSCYLQKIATQPVSAFDDPIGPLALTLSQQHTSTHNNNNLVTNNAETNSAIVKRSIMANDMVLDKSLWYQPLNSSNRPLSPLLRIVDQAEFGRYRRRAPAETDAITDSYTDPTNLEPHSQSHDTADERKKQNTFMLFLRDAWEFLQIEFRNFEKFSHKFLMRYDLKFIGVLHAINSMCLQHLAVKVAVIRSYFCSPCPTYI